MHVVPTVAPRLRHRHSVDRDTLWGLHALCLAACVFPYMLLMAVKLVESEDDSYSADFVLIAIAIQ